MIQLDAHSVDTPLHTDQDPRSNTLTFNKINLSLLFHHITKIIIEQLF